MSDREKVINALQCCLDDRQADCAACYQQGPGFGIVCRENLMRDALELLKEDERELNSLGKSLCDATKLLRNVKLSYNERR